MAAVPSIGRATRFDEPVAPEAEATRSLYEQYANQIFRYCLHQLGSREEAEDAVQSTFLNAFRGIKRGVVPELESAWLFKIAHNVCLSRRRSAWRRGRVESPADFEVVEELAAAPSRRADELIGLQDVLEQMPETQRRAILLREWQGLSYREIADELEVSQAAVETLIFRARRTLASGLEQPLERRRRAARVLDFGNVAAGLKSVFLGGSVAAKVAATVAVVSATTVAATAPVIRHREHRVAPNKAPVATRPVRHARPRPVAPALTVPAVVRSIPAVTHRPQHHAPIRPHRTVHSAVHAARSVAKPTAPAPAVVPPAIAPTPAAPPAPAPAASQPAAQTPPAASHGNGNGHAYGRTKHLQPVPPESAPPAEQPQPAVQPAPPAAAPGQSGVAHGNGQSDVQHGNGNAYGHDKNDKSGGDTTAPVDPSGS